MTKRPKKDPAVHSSDNITIGDISGGTGFAIGSGAKATVNQNTGESLDKVAAVFQALAQAVHAMPEGSDKSVAENAVQSLEKEARKGDRADEHTVQKWMSFLAETAPDAWEVAVNTFANPVLGLGMAFKKIAEKAKAGREDTQKASK